MTQTFSISDALRCIVTRSPRGPNWACSWDSGAFRKKSGRPAFWKGILGQRKHRVTLVWWKGARFGGLASAKTRSGHRAWEVDHLYLPETIAGLSFGKNEARFDGDIALLEIMECLCQAVGWRYGERVFLRLSPDSPVIPVARRAGFFPYFQETLLEGSGGPSPDEGVSTPGGLRPARQEDQFPLFQLFSATTPPRQREALGLTFDQWRDSLERRSGNRQEWVVERRGRIAGWLHLSLRDGAAEGELLTHPGHPDLLPELIQVALAHPGRQSWRVPDYQGRTSVLLQDRGFQEVAQYTMFIKTVAAPVRRPGMAPVEA